MWAVPPGASLFLPFVMYLLGEAWNFAPWRGVDSHAPHLLRSFLCTTDFFISNRSLMGSDVFVMMDTGERSYSKLLSLLLTLLVYTHRLVRRLVLLQQRSTRWFPNPVFCFGDENNMNMSSQIMVFHVTTHLFREAACGACPCSKNEKVHHRFGHQQKPPRGALA